MVLTSGKVRCAPSSPCSRRSGRCAWLRAAVLLSSPALRAMDALSGPGQESRRFGRTGKLASRRSRMDDTIALRIERDRRPVAGLAAPASWVELACLLVKFVPAGQQTAIPAGMAP